jgi:heme/copper-type cytochrome/quinol oxidase subunit 3
MCYLSKKPSKYFSFFTLFSAHGDVVVGFAIFHIVIFQKRKKEKKKRHSSMVCESWWAPDGIG